MRLFAFFFFFFCHPRSRIDYFRTERPKTLFRIQIYYLPPQRPSKAGSLSLPQLVPQRPAGSSEHWGPSSTSYSGPRWWCCVRLFKSSVLQTHHVFQPLLYLSYPHAIQTLTWIAILREEADGPNSKILHFFGNVFKIHVFLHALSDFLRLPG